jgi:hypothetical protein
MTARSHGFAIGIGDLMVETAGGGVAKHDYVPDRIGMLHGPTVIVRRRRRH